MLCHCACKHVRLSCVLNKLLTYLLIICKQLPAEFSCIIYGMSGPYKVVLSKVKWQALEVITDLWELLKNMSETNENLSGDDSVTKNLLKGVTVSRFACTEVFILHGIVCATLNLFTVMLDKTSSSPFANSLHCDRERLHNLNSHKNLWNWTKPSETSRKSVVRDVADRFWGWQQLMNYRDPENKSGALGGDILKKQRFVENYVK